MIEAAALDEERGVRGTDTQGRQGVVAAQRVVAHRGQGCPHVERGQGAVLGEGLHAHG